jgi:hypothetical protein
MADCVAAHELTLYFALNDFNQDVFDSLEPT